jgi:hypothetical protein
MGSKRKREVMVDVLVEYAELCEDIKALEARKAALKPAVEAVLRPLGGTFEVECMNPPSRFTWSEPTDTHVDVDLLKLHVTPHLFRQVTKRVHDLEALRAALSLGKLNAEALAAITYTPATPRVVVTPRVAA